MGSSAVNHRRSDLPLVGIDEEITAAESGAAFIDASSTGRLRVTGADRVDLLHRLSTNDLLGLRPFSSAGTVFTTDKGRIVDYVHVLVYQDSLLLVTSPGRESTLERWIAKYTIMEDIQLSVITSETTMYSIVGPNAFEAARFIVDDLPQAGKISESVVNGVTVTLDHGREFGIDRVSVILPHEHAPWLQQKILEKEGARAPISAISDPAYQFYRILHGIPGGEAELVDLFNPYEVGLRHAISFTKGCYIGQEVIARLDTYQKVQRRLALISFDQHVPLTSPSVAITKNSAQVGTLTSTSEVSFHGRYVGLGVIKKDGTDVGDEIEVGVQSPPAKGVIRNLFQ